MRIDPFPVSAEGVTLDTETSRLASPAISLHSVTPTASSSPYRLSDGQDVVSTVDDVPNTDRGSPAMSSVLSSLATPRGHHYPGRPLPRLPDAPSSINPAPAVSISAATILQNWNTAMRNHSHRRAGNVPEGLLIDFNDGDHNVDDDLVGPFPNTSSSSIGSIASESSSDMVTLQYAIGVGFNPRPYRQPSNTWRPLHSPPSPSALVGSVAFNSRLYRQPSNTRRPSSSPPSPSALVGRIEIEGERNRRQDSGSSSSSSRDHGLVKPKLSLLGLIVESCGICLSQFEEGELAALGVGCQHAFHENCLKTWLARSRTCPFCRAPLHISDSYGIP